MSEEYQAKDPALTSKQETCVSPFRRKALENAQKVTRRRFLVTMSGVGVALCAGSIGAGCGGPDPIVPHLLHRFQDMGTVTSLAWSPDGTRMVSGSFDATAKIWHVATEKLLSTLPCGDVVTSVAWSPDGTRIASGQWGHVVRIWESTTGKLLTAYSGPRSSNSVAWSYDHIRLAVGYAGRPGVDRMVKVWDTTAGKSTLTYSNDQKNVHAVAWSPSNPRLLASGTDLNNVYIRDIKTNTTVLTYHRHGNQINTIAWSPLTLSKQYIASGSGDYDLGAPLAPPPIGDTTVHIWEAETGKNLFIYEGHLKTVTALAWSPDGKYIASGSADATVQVWQPFNGHLIAQYTGHSSDVNAVAWSPNGQYIASGGADKTIHIWQF